MKQLVWDDVLSIGNDEIDNDHRILVDLFNLLGRSVSDGAESRYVAAVLAELINATAWHFSHEERLMLENAYPDRDLHRRDHRALMTSVRDLEQHYLNRGELEEADFDFLESWLTEHILVADMKFGTFLLESA